MKRLLFTVIIFSTFFSYSSAQNMKQSKEYENKLNDIRIWLNKTSQGVINLWETKAAINKAIDGFYGNIDLNGNSSKGYNRNSIQQARQLWAFSTWYLYEDKSNDIKQICYNQYKYLINTFYDPVEKEFFLNEGDKKSGNEGRRLYNTSFCIFATAQYYLAFKDNPDKEVKKSAYDAFMKSMKCFVAMDKRCHDPEYLGYQQIPTGNLALNEQQLDGGDKENNTHIHILESLTTLYKAYKEGGSDYISKISSSQISEDTKVYLSNNLKKRLNEMLVDVVAKKFCAEKNGFAFIRRRFDRKWNLEDNSTFSFAHDIETSWLMIEAMKVLGKDCSDPGLVRKLAKEMIRNVYEHGMVKVGNGYACAALGNFSDFSVRDYSKDFWQHFEAILGLYTGIRLSSDPVEQNKYINRINDIPVYLDLPVNQGGLKVTISNNMWEYAYRNTLGDEWKASYHDLRSMIYAQKWIREDISASPKK